MQPSHTFLYILNSLLVTCSIYKAVVIITVHSLGINDNKSVHTQYRSILFKVYLTLSWVYYENR